MGLASVDETAYSSNNIKHQQRFKKCENLYGFNSFNFNKSEAILGTNFGGFQLGGFRKNRIISGAFLVTSLYTTFFECERKLSYLSDSGHVPTKWIQKLYGHPNF